MRSRYEESNMAQTSHEPDEMITGINVTPLVDVVLVLLIILMVTASYIVSKSIPMELPNAKTGESSEAPLTISVDKHERLYLDGDPVSEAELERAAGRASQANPDARAMIAADGATQHRSVVKVIDLLRRSGVSKFAINVNPSDLEPYQEL
jgi:biopolymer transport protein ExbD